MKSGIASSQRTLIVMTECLLPSAFRVGTLGGNLLREENWQESNEDHKRRDHIRHRAVARTDRLAEDPDGKRVFAVGEGGDNDFVKGKREASIPPASKAVPMLGKTTWRKV